MSNYWGCCRTSRRREIRNPTKPEEALAGKVVSRPSPPHDLSFPWGSKFWLPASSFFSARHGPIEVPQLLHPSNASMLLSSQAAEKEAALAQQEEEKVEQRKRARAEKKALKKKKKTRGADKRKAEEDDEKEWGDDEEGRAFWKCYLGTLLTSREVTDTVQRTSV